MPISSYVDYATSAYSQPTYVIAMSLIGSHLTYFRVDYWLWQSWLLTLTITLVFH